MRDPDQQAVTLADEAIHNPAEPRHFMRIKPVRGRVRVSRDGTLLAETRRALRVLEVGRDVYDPMIYVPREDVRIDLVPTDATGHCPLKGDWRAVGGAGASPIGWIYEKPFVWAGELKDRVVFDPSKVTIEEAP